MQVGEGTLVFLPYPPFAVDSDKLVSTLARCAKPILTRDMRTPAPDWTADFLVPGEAELFQRIGSVQQNIDELQQGKEELESERQELLDYQGLIYEQGTPLETVVKQALQLLGFSAEPYQNDDIDHDVLLRAAEGVAVAEVEGKDNNAVNIEKLDQLGRVEDEYRNEHDGDYPDAALLIGNAYRLTHPDDRKDPFTDKALKTAKRKNFGLLTTVDLFKATVRVLENPDDDDFKVACRKAILETKGQEIHLPFD